MHVEGLDKSLRMSRIASQLEIGIGDSAIGVFGRHKMTSDVIGPLNAPYDRDIGLTAFLGLDGIA